MATDSPFHLRAVLDHRAPTTTRRNPPGLPALRYGAGQYSDFVVRMLHTLRTTTVQDVEGRDLQPLRRHNLLAHDDWTLALLRSWALVTDILAFYQERIINESYLRTATERRSVLELIRAIGYELAPPLAASTHLAFSVLPDSEDPGAMRIPGGLAVQSIPNPFAAHDAVRAIVEGTGDPIATLPLTFETTGALAARPEWNTLYPARFVDAPWPAAGAPTLRLAGHQSGLNPGAGLLLLSTPPEERRALDPAARCPPPTPPPATGDGTVIEEGRVRWQLLLLDMVTPNPTHGYTEVTWARAPGHVPPGGIPAPRALALRRQRELFTYSPGPLFRDTAGGWLPANIGLPAKPVRAAAANLRGRLYVAIEKELYHSRDRGDSWAPIATGLTPKDIYSVATSPAGAVAVGTDDGVLLSKDGGDAWVTLSGPGELEIPSGWRRFLFPARRKMPKTVVRALLHRSESEMSLLAGTDDGVFAYDSNNDSWESMNGRFPALDREKGTATITVNALAATRDGKRLLAGTDRGVFPVERLFHPPGNKMLIAVLAFLLLLPTTVAALLEPPGEVEGGPTITVTLEANGGGARPTRVSEPPATAIGGAAGGAGSEADSQEAGAPLLAGPDGIEEDVTELLIVLTLLVLLYQIQPRRLALLVGGIALAYYLTQPWWVIAEEVATVIVNLLAEMGAEVDVQQAGALIMNPVTILLLTLLLANGGFALLVRLPGMLRELREAIPFMAPRVSHPQPPVFDLRVTERAILAATNQGVFQLEVPPGRWTRLRRWGQRLLFGPLPEPWTLMAGWADFPDEAHEARSTVYTLAQDAGGQLMAGTAAGQLFVRHGDRWLLDVDMPLSSVRALVVATDSTGTPFMVAAGEPEDARAERRWAPAHLANGWVDLPLQASGILPGTAAVVLDGDHAELLTLTEIAHLPSHDVAQGGQITRLTVAERGALRGLDRTTSTVHYLSEPLPFHDDLFVDQPLSGRCLILRGTGLALDPKQGDHAPKKRQLALVGMPVGETERQVGELITVERAVEADSRTILHLRDTLTQHYQRESVTLYGNLAPAVHGETVRGEFLGESDGTKPNQRFALRRPLAYLPTPSDEYGITLGVKLRGILWRKVPSLLDQPPDARVYMVRRDERGAATIIFGDGEQGARLPTSRDGLTADYRSGGGAVGNLPLHTLSLLLSRSPRISEVTNPLPATGGEEAEPTEQGRRLAPGRLQALKRIVALNDFIHFSRNFPGVGKAAILSIPSAGNPREGALRLAVAPRRPRALLHNAPLLKRLAEAIAAVRSNPHPPVAILPYRLTHFRLQCTLYLAPAWNALSESGRDELAETIRQRVRAHFDFHARDLGQPVTRAELFALLQEMREVRAVTIDTLARSDRAPTSADPDSSDLVAEWRDLLLPDPTTGGVLVALAPPIPGDAP